MYNKMTRLILCLFSVAVMATADERSLDDILRDGNNVFTAKMFNEAVKTNTDQSVALSAFSVLTPLAQLALASVGESHDELLATIGMPNDNITKAVFSRVNAHLRSVKGVTLKSASKIYVAKSYELNSDFAVITRDVFGPEVANVDFSENVKTAHEVNLWVEEQTNNRIKYLVDPFFLCGDMKALLVNTIYFKGLWEIPFDRDATMDRDFHISKENIIKVPTMYNEDNYRYIDSQELDAQVLELKYEGGEAALYVVLPHEVDGIRKLEDKLTDPSLLDNVIESMYDTEVEVQLPKFIIETETDLKQVLENTNVKKMFNEQEARLDNLLKDGNNALSISEAKQKPFIEVNEEGAEAAAANCQVPEQWKSSDIILLYKKGDPEDISNYRPISLLSSTYKLFTSILKCRMSPKIDRLQTVEQAGFRSGFSTTDHIQVMQQVMEKYKEFNRPLYIAFIDYTKAFDTISHDAIWEALNKCQINDKYIRVLEDIYNGSVSQVKLETRGPKIPICRGVRQGDPLSPKLFIAVLQNIFDNLNWQAEGICVNQDRLSHLRFADDIVLFAETSKKLEKMINCLYKESEKVGLKMNEFKTKLLTNSYTNPINLKNNSLEYVKHYIYLGKQLSFEDEVEEQEVERRVNMSWKKFWSMKEILKDFGIMATSLIINQAPTPEFFADRPFYFVVKEKSLSLFNGVYAGN